MQLRDLGERRVILEYVLPHLARNDRDGLDDCAVLPLGEDRVLVLTTDAGPRRTFLDLLDVGSLVDRGHYFATMSLSDIAAMGAQPIALVGALMLAPDMEPRQVAQLIEGLQTACHECGAAYVGGDTKEGDAIRVVTTAVGLAREQDVLWRSGTTVGDYVCLSGPIGKTLASYVDACASRSTPRPIHRPRARIDLGLAISSKGVASACIDMSDGPIAAARELAEQNGVDIVLDRATMQVVQPSHRAALGDDWENLVMNVGGDYELMVTVPPERLAEAKRIGLLACGSAQSTRSDTPAVRVVNSHQSLEIRPWEHFGHTAWISEALSKLV